MNLKIYKSGQGYYTRMGTAIGCGVMAALGCWALFNTLDAIPTTGVITSNAKEWIRAVSALALFAILAFLVFKAVNKSTWADFMIQTEGEMKKVSWSNRKEIIRSTIVVLVTVLLMAMILAGIDFGFHKLFTLLEVLQ